MDMGDELADCVSWSSVSSRRAAPAFFGYRFILMSAFRKRRFGSSVMKPLPLLLADDGGAICDDDMEVAESFFAAVGGRFDENGICTDVESIFVTEAQSVWSYCDELVKISAEDNRTR